MRTIICKVLVLALAHYLLTPMFQNHLANGQHCSQFPDIILCCDFYMAFYIQAGYLFLVIILLEMYLLSGL